MNFTTVNFSQDGALIQGDPTAVGAIQSPGVGNPVTNAISALAQTAIADLTSLIPPGTSMSYGNGLQTSALPYRKPVSFYLQDRNGNRVTPTPGSGFQDGYFFKMRINPSNFAITLPPKTVVPIRTMGGWKLQYWYPELGSIKADGIIGNMLEAYNRDLKDSDAWRSFANLIKVYTQNGVPYTAPGTSNRRLVQNQFSPIVVCTFDRYQYYGYFENLEYTESEETPNTIKYSFSYRFANMADLGDIVGMTAQSFVDAGALQYIAPQGGINNNVNPGNF